VVRAGRRVCREARDDLSSMTGCGQSVADALLDLRDDGMNGLAKFPELGAAARSHPSQVLVDGGVAPHLVEKLRRDRTTRADPRANALDARMPSPSN
jgi:hypothetical protein